MKSAEVWRDIDGFQGRYMVSNLGRVWSNVTNKPLSPGRTAAGYMTVAIRLNGESRSHYVHILVAKAFILNPMAKRTVNHKNGNRADNAANNLEWATHGENHKHAYNELGREPGYRAKGSDNACAKRVTGVSETGETVAFGSLKEAAVAHGVTHSAISRAISLECVSAGKRWSYA